MLNVVSSNSRMDPQSAAEKAVGVIGMGYDLTADILLSACKAGPNGSRLIQLDESVTKDLEVLGGLVVPDVPASIVCGKGDRTRFCSDVLDFNQMSELFNQDLSLPGKIPSGLFNSMFDFKGCWQRDAADTKYLAFDGWFITLYNIELVKSQITLSDRVKLDVPTSWDPPAIAEFINKYGTHIVVGVKMGGKDVFHMKQLQISNMEPIIFLQLLKQLADRKFTEDTDGSPSLNRIVSSGLPKEEQSVLWNLKSSFANGSRTSIISYSKNEDVICNHIRCGGIEKGQSHRQWLSTVSQSPDVISMSFVPIASLLSHVPGNGFLSHAINLYMRYKPPVEDLVDFLEFQLPRQWAPIFSDLPLARVKKQASPYIQFRFLGPKIFVNTTMADSRKEPVTGIRLYLEGKNGDHLSIHLQHLVKFSSHFQVTENQGYEPLDEQVQQCYFEPVKWTSFSHVCTVPVEYHGAMMEDSACIVTRAWFEVKKINMRKVLFLRLGFSMVASARIRRSEWDESTMLSENSGLISMLSGTLGKGKNQPDKADVNVNSAVYPGGPPVPVRAPRIKQFVNTKEMVRGPEVAPGHWVVTGAKLCVEGGRIGLQVKYSVLKLGHAASAPC